MLIFSFNLFSGSDHICALFTNKGVRCWGYGGDGVLGSDSQYNVVLLDAMGYITFSDTSEVVRFSKGPSARHVIIYFFHHCIDNRPFIVSSFFFQYLFDHFTIL